MPLSNPPKLSPSQIASLKREIAAEQAEEPWQAATLENGWLNWGSATNTAGFKKHANTVYLQGLLTGTQAVYGMIFVLPVGLRPSKRSVFIAATGDTINYALVTGRIDIFSDGSVFLINGGWGFVSLDGMNFKLDDAG